MKEILVKVLIFLLVLILLILEFLKIGIPGWEIIIKLLVLLLLIIIIVVEAKKPKKKKKKLCHAFIYQHKENRSIFYCDNDSGDETRDFRKIGDGPVPCDQVDHCDFVK